jgi:hypothetical protein
MPQNRETKYVDHLTEDDPIPGQLWVCMSFLSPEGIKNCSVRGLKIRGVFTTREEADERADQLSKTDDFHVFVGEVGKWLPWDPDPNDVKDQVYQEKELNDLMKGYKDNLEKAKKMQQQRKSDMIQNTSLNDNKKSQTQDRLRKKLEERKQKKKMEDLAKKKNEMMDVRVEEIDEEFLADGNSKSGNKNKNKKRKKGKKGGQNQQSSELENKEKLAKMELDRLQETQKDMNAKKDTLNDIDDQLDKIKELYKKLNEKQESSNSNNDQSTA